MNRALVPVVEAAEHEPDVGEFARAFCASGSRAARKGVRSLRRALSPAGRSLLFRGGVCAALRRIRPSRKLAILRYHAICGPEGYTYADPALCITPQAFERHVKYLTDHYEVVSLPDVVRALRERKAISPNAVAITFDDGYGDNLEAARTLHRYGVSGTFYLTAGCLAGDEPFWPSELRMLLPSIEEDLLEISAGEDWIRLPVTTAWERAAAVDRLTALFKSYPIPLRESMRRQLRAKAKTASMPSPMLTWEAVREMQQLGMTIGAHTLTHANLPSAGFGEATVEIRQSKRLLEEELGSEVTMFAYPNGGAEIYYTPEVGQLVRSAGFEAAATSRNGFASIDSDLYALERIRVAERLADLVFALEVERFAFKPGATP